MPYKVCPSCKQSSYSACLSGIWLCPYCGKELTLCKAIHNRRCITAPPSTEHEAQHISGRLHILPHK